MACGDAHGPTTPSVSSALRVAASVTTGREQIVFHSRRDGAVEVYTMNPDGSAQTRLTFSGRVDAFPALSPDWTKIAFQSERDAFLPEIYVMNADGTGRAFVSPGLDPAWSPDGSRVAFHDGAGIYVMNADGSNRVQLSVGAEWDRFPAWSPDGSRIAFVSALNLQEDIWVMNADGTAKTRLTSAPPGNAGPHWGTPGRAPVRDIAIDIRPGSDDNVVNCSNLAGIVPVAVLTDAQFDAATLDAASAAFGPAGALEAHGRAHLEDVDGDGDVDAVLHFRFGETGLSCADGTARLSARTLTGQEIAGSDALRMLRSGARGRT